MRWDSSINENIGLAADWRQETVDDKDHVNWSVNGGVIEIANDMITIARSERRYRY